MKIIIIHDDPNKIREFRDFFRSEAADAEIDSATSVRSAMGFLSEFSFDLIVLDVVIPMYDDGNPSESGSQQILLEIDRALRCKRQGVVVGVTSLNGIVDSYSRNFGRYGWNLVDAESPGCFNTIRAEIGRMQRPVLIDENNVDYCIVNALASPETSAFLNLGDRWEVIDAPNMVQRLRRSIFQTANGPRTVIMATCIEMGCVNSAVITALINEWYAPKWMIMCGICAGVRGKTSLGDIVLATHSWDYLSGKLTSDSGENEVFRPDERSVALTDRAASILQELDFLEKCVNGAFHDWAGDLMGSRPKVVRGPVASGSWVVANRDLMEALGDRRRGVVGLEMESYGFYFAARHSGNSQGNFLMAKSVCDFGEEDKHDGAQAFAAHMSASFVRHAIIDGVFE